MSAPASKQYLCGGCMKLRNPQRFSETALLKYENAVRHATRNRKPLSSVRRPVCGACNLSNAHEFQCAKCGIMKSIEAFSGQQRKQGDDKECRDCVQEREDREPVFQDEVLEHEIIDKLKQGMLLDEHFSANGSVVGGSHRSRQPRVARSSSDGEFYDTFSWTGSVPIPENPISHTSYGTGLRSERDVTYTHSQSSQVSSSLTKGTNRSRWDDALESTYTPYREHFGSATSHVTHSGEGNPGFAKQGAVKATVEDKAYRQLERQRLREEEEQGLESQMFHTGDSDSDDDGSDNDAPY